MTNFGLLKTNLKKLNLDYFLLPNSDEFLSEYLPEYAKRLQFITGFTGSNAFVIIGQKKSSFFTDGRYSLQAVAEVNKKDFEILNLADILPLTWLLKNTKKNSSIGFDPALHSINFVHNLQKHFGNNLVALEKNPVDAIWKNQPQPLKTKVFKHSEKYSGLSSQEKIKKITTNLDKNIDAVILTNPASICWLFNIRASDIKYSPLLLGYAIIYKNGTALLFPQKLESDFLNNIPDSRFGNYNIQLDFNQANYQIYQILESRNINIINKPDPCLIHKAIKNSTEIKNAIIAHKIDGLAVTKFLFWLENTIAKKANLDEIRITKKLSEFRRKNKKFLYESFATIAGFGSNGAIIHYHANKKTNKKIKGNGLLLIDSGGQYLEGTTDITRTIAVGKPTKEMIENFTDVLKGHINLACTKFQKGTTGSSLDILARRYLQQKGLDYAHGTGHGVGSFSSVHESPPSISKKDDGVALQPGMILSNEPGYYKEGKYGIRIENLILIYHPEQSEISYQAKSNLLRFQTLTLAPIDPKLINFNTLTKSEKQWLCEYHQKIYEELKKKLSREEKIWLEKIVNTYDSQLSAYD